MEVTNLIGTAVRTEGRRPLAFLKLSVAGGAAEELRDPFRLARDVRDNPKLHTRVVDGEKDAARSSSQAFSHPKQA